MKASENGMKEVALSQLAAQRATNAEVKSFAQQMVTEHTQVNQALMQLAQQKGVTLDGMSDMMGDMTSTSSSRSTPGTSSSRQTSGSGSSMASSTGDTSSSTAGTSGSGTSSSGMSGSGMTGSYGSTSSDTSGMMPNSMTNDRHYRRLARETGKDFDEEYMDAIVDLHEDAVKLFEKTSTSADDTDVRSFASQHVGALRQHLDKAKSLAKTVD